MLLTLIMSGYAFTAEYFYTKVRSTFFSHQVVIVSWLLQITIIFLFLIMSHYSKTYLFLSKQVSCLQIILTLSSFGGVQFSSQLCPTLCDPMNCSTPGFPVHHQLWELAQTHVHQVGDVIQPSHPSSSSSPPAFNLSQHQGLPRIH